MSMLTINETAKETGLSSYEIRRRVHNGSCPHIRVGDKESKILILFDKFIKQIEEEVYKNMQNSIDISQDTADTTGFSKIRQIG